MDYTKNLNLSKPSYSDDVDVQVLNNNMDILDDNLQRTNAKMSDYLPLAGGTMKGNINVPYGKGLGLSQTGANGFINFNTTSFHEVVLPTLAMKADRLKFYCPNSKEFVVDDDGVWFNNDALIRDLYTSNDEFSGFTKLSTGLLMQWGFVNPKGSLYNVRHATFKTPMASSSYAVVTSRSFYTGSRPSNNENRWGSVTFNFTTTGFDICCAEPSAFGTAEFWIAIGRYN